MTDWQTTVRISDLHESYREDGITIQEMARFLLDRLNKNSWIQKNLVGRMDYTEITDELEEMINDPELEIQDWGYFLERLYDFSDYHKIWVNALGV